MFYVMDAINRVLPGDRPNVTVVNKFDEINSGMRCYQRKLKPKENRFTPRPYYCPKYKESFLKKLEKFERDPSNEKVLGHKVIKYIENQKLLNKISEKLGYTNRKWTTSTYQEGKYYGQKTDAESLAAVG